MDSVVMVMSTEAMIVPPGQGSLKTVSVFVWLPLSSCVSLFSETSPNTGASGSQVMETFKCFSSVLL